MQLLIRASLSSVLSQSHWSMHTPLSVTRAPCNLPRPHTHVHTVNCSSSLAVCTSSGRPESVIAASVAWTDRRTGDWRWHAPIISGPSAVFAITEDLAEHTESDSGILYSEAISTPTGCTASVGPGLNSTGLGLCASLKICSGETHFEKYEPEFVLHCVYLVILLDLPFDWKALMGELL